MCVGTPVLTSTGSCFAETGGEAARYANPLVPEEIAIKLKHMLTDATLCASMVADGYKQAELFSDEHVAQNINKILNELCVS
jgi:glycosyltransferase involved in cell wall biosynthesis